MNGNHPPSSSASSELAENSATPGIIEATLAEQAAEENDWPKAINSIRQAINRSPNNPDYLAQMGAYLFQDNQFDAAANACHRALEVAPKHIAAISNLANIVLQQKRGEEAEKLFRQATELAPKQPEVWLNFCSAIVDTPAREHEAATYAQHAIDLAPRHLKAHLLLCKALLNQGRPESAKAIVERAAAISPRNAEVHFRIGLCAMLLGKLTDAIQHFSLALTIDPKDAKVYRMLAEIFISRDNYPAAEEAMREAIRQGDASVGNHWHLAQILFFLRKYPESMTEIQREFGLEKNNHPSDSGSKRGYTTAPFSSVKDWCTSHQLPISETLPERRIDITAATFIDDSGTYHPSQTTNVIIPPAYIATISDALLYAERGVILVDRGRHALYDALATLKDGYALECCEFLPMMNDDTLAVASLPAEETELAAGIYLVADAANNYAHWLTEVLTRFHALDTRPEFQGIPLLIPPNLYPQQLETVRLMARGRYPIHTLQAGKTLRVKKLIFPSTPIGHFKNRRKPNDPPPPQEATFHPEPLLHVRNRIIGSLACDGKTRRRLWISRKTHTAYRRFLNEDEVERVFIKNGFEPIQPENLSFSEQVRLFSEAEIIAGGTGAGMANIIFSRKNAQILIFTAFHPLANFNYFNNIAKTNSQKVIFVLGEMLNKISMRNYSYQNDFSVAPELAEAAIARAKKNATI